VTRKVHWNFMPLVATSDSLKVQTIWASFLSQATSWSLLINCHCLFRLSATRITTLQLKKKQNISLLQHVNLS